MKKYNLFGFHISLDVKRNHNKEKEAELYSHEYLLRSFNVSGLFFLLCSSRYAR